MMGFHSAHLLINKERSKRGRPCLVRSEFLDQKCQQHAQTMASQQKLLHEVDTIQELKKLVNSCHCAEHIQRGSGVQEMHKASMNARMFAYNNIISKKFVEFGVGTCMGGDGKLYMVQLFRGPPAIEEGGGTRLP